MSLLLLGGVWTLVVILVILFFVHRMKISEGFAWCTNGKQSTTRCGSCNTTVKSNCPTACVWDATNSICYDRTISTGKR